MPIKTTRRDFLKISGISLLGMMAKYNLDALVAKSRISPMQDQYQEILTTCRVCGQSCPTPLVTVKNGTIISVRHKFPIEGLESYFAACGRPRGGIPGMVYNPDRLKYPLKRVGPRGSGQFEVITWEEALNTIAQKLKEYRDAGHPEYVAAFIHLIHGGGWVKNFFKIYGTPNITKHSSTCHTDRDAAYKTFFGKFVGPGGLATDYLNADLVIFAGGRNPFGGIVATTWTKMLSEGKKRGLKLIVIDPKYTEVAEVADQWIPIKPGTDLALFLAMINEVINKGYYDEDFLKTYTNATMLIDASTGDPLGTKEIESGDWAGKLDYLVYDGATGSVVYKSEASDPTLDYTGEYNGKTVKTAFTMLKERVKDYTPDWAEGITGIPADTIRNLVKMLNDYKPRACIDHGYKAARWMNTRETWRALMMVNILIGAFGKEGTIIWSNKIKPSTGIKGSPSAESVFDYHKSEYPLHVSGANPSLVIKSILEEKPYPIKAAVIWNQNVLAGTAGYVKIKEALEKLDFIVYIDIMPNETMLYADIVLPQATFVEQDSPSLMGTSKTPLPMVSVMKKIVDPMFEAKPEYWIIKELARRVLSQDEYNETYGKFPTERDIWQWQVEKLKEKYPEIDYNTLVEQGVFVGKTTPVYDVYKGGKPLSTKTGEIEIYSLELQELYKQYNNDETLDPLPRWIPPRYMQLKETLADDEFVLVEGRCPLHTNQGFTRNVPMLINTMREYFDVECVYMNSERAKKLGLKDGDVIEITNEETQVSLRARVKVSEAIHPDALFGYYGMVIGPGTNLDKLENGMRYAPVYGINTNFLAPFHVSPRSGGSAAQDFIVKVKKVG